MYNKFELIIKRKKRFQLLNRLRQRSQLTQPQLGTIIGKPILIKMLKKHSINQSTL